MSKLARKTVEGVIWSSVERFSLQGVQFLIGVVLARMLTPSDYGLIGMLSVFFGVSQIFIDCGFSNSLIRQRKVSEKDYGTVFVLNVLISFIAYLVLFCAAPIIASFYKVAELKPILRVLSVTLIINSLYAVQQTRLNKNVDFKTLSKCSLTSAILSGCLGIYLAYNGYGVWSLVYQGIANSILMFVCLFAFTKWMPHPCFDKNSFQNLFGFGSKILLSSLIHTIYVNLYNIVIGKLFSAKQLGFFNKAEQVGLLPSSNFAGVLSRVAYPILAEMQDDNVKLKVAYEKFLRLSCFVVFPLMIGLCVLAKPSIQLMFGEKWLETALFLQILCVGFMFDPICSINVNVLYVKGRSDLVLKLEIVKKTIAILILACSIPFGVIGICCGRAFYGIVSTFLNMIYTKRMINVSVFDQIKIIIPQLFLAILMGIVVLIFCSYLDNIVLQVLVGFFVGAFVYMGLAYILRFKAVWNIYELIKGKH